ncbi:LOB domain-containing protein 15-like isoform X2 [Musa acuminata AAA Group]|uniref:LOB domain-containing protein n=1 Tax=Musa acuminata subsp. malaccensis TaxID=214687 RepID=A0A804L5H3_MUSAM|nr:PREDICTED: LOB domain-containing protein 15-like [Musa acuminata subsp. malaccensis]
MSTPRERMEEVGKKIKREADGITDRIGRQVGPVGTLNTITPCAACKLLRRRCAQDCPFSPYFSPHEPQKFALVHKVFGASNVSKMLMEVPEPQRADAANSLVYEANLRLRDPVYGCMGAISALQQQVQALEAELQAVRAEILKHKYGQAGGNIIPTSHAALLPPSAAVSVAAPPPVPLPSLSPVTDAASSSNYTSLPSSSTNYSSITTNHNVAYFG